MGVGGRSRAPLPHGLAKPCSHTRSMFVTYMQGVIAVVSNCSLIICLPLLATEIETYNQKAHAIAGSETEIYTYIIKTWTALLKNILVNVPVWRRVSGSCKQSGGAGLVSLMRCPAPPKPAAAWLQRQHGWSCP